MYQNTKDCVAAESILLLVALSLNTQRTAAQLNKCWLGCPVVEHCARQHSCKSPGPLAATQVTQLGSVAHCRFRNFFTESFHLSGLDWPVNLISLVEISLWRTNWAQFDNFRVVNKCGHWNIPTWATCDSWFRLLKRLHWATCFVKIWQNFNSYLCKY